MPKKQITLAVGDDLLAAVERLHREAVERSGLRVPRAEMLRVVIERGLAAIASDSRSGQTAQNR